jgi:hypothetical protein
MGIRDDIWADVAEAFDEDLADAVQDFSFERVTVGEIDPVTGVPTGGDEVLVSGRGVFGGYSSADMAAASNSSDGQHIESTDVKLLALQLEVINEAGEMVKPVEGDYITYADGTMRAVRVGKDPASATWVIQLRRT